MMKLHILFGILAASLTYGQNVSPGASDLLTVLRSEPDTQAFAQLLGEHPELVQNLNSAKSYTVFAPSNAAVAAFRQSFNVNGSLSSRARSLYRRSIPDYAAAIALLFTERSKQQKFGIESVDLITNLTDPNFINLGPASASATRTSASFSLAQSTPTSKPSPSSSVPPTAIPTLPSFSSILPSTTLAPISASSAPASVSTVLPVSSPLPPTPSSAAPMETEPAHLPSPKSKNLKRSISLYSNHHRRQSNGSTLPVFSGFGKVTEVSLSEMAYNNGAIRKADSFFTLFGDLAATLQQTNGTAFARALTQAGMLDSLSKTPRITVFVPSDAVLNGQDLTTSALQRYVLLNTLATTSSLTAGTYNTSGGSSVKITTNSGGSFSVNNATIIKSDVMIKNGVIHYIDNVYTGTYTGSATGLKSSMILVVTGLVIAFAGLY